MPHYVTPRGSMFARRNQPSDNRHPFASKTWIADQPSGARWSATVTKSTKPRVALTPAVAQNRRTVSPMPKGAGERPHWPEKQEVGSARL
ncbi:hypothetical protein GCM10023085_06610 [Actinomadura viridis]